MKNTKHAEVTAAIVAKLEEGCAPWVRPWAKVGVSDMPANALTHQRYRGVNVLSLWAAQEIAQHPTSEWLTFRQALALGGSVRKGEKGTTVFFASAFDVTEERAGEEISRRVPFLKAYSVFNVAQCDGIATSAPVVLPEFVRIERAHAFVRALGATVRHYGDRAYYSPSDDAITLPPPSAFESPSAYYATNLHEHAHWTGAPHRLARTFGKRLRR